MYFYSGSIVPSPRFLGEPPAGGAFSLRRVMGTFNHPFRTVCRVHVRTTNDGNSVGSGVLITPHHVLTCAHILYPRDNPNPRQVTVLPNHDGPEDKRPPIPANAWAVRPGWQLNACQTFDRDLAIIRLARRSDVDPWRLESFDPARLTGAHVHLAGYPKFSRDDRAFWMNRSEGQILGGFTIVRCCLPGQCRGRDQTREQVSGSDFTNVSNATNLVAHTLDTRQSMSGGPIWFFDNGRPVLVALHAGDIEDGSRKKAVLLNEATRALITDWTTRQFRPL